MIIRGQTKINIKDCINILNMVYNKVEIIVDMDDCPRIIKCKNSEGLVEVYVTDSESQLNKVGTYKISMEASVETLLAFLDVNGTFKVLNKETGKTIYKAEDIQCYSLGTACHDRYVIINIISKSKKDYLNTKIVIDNQDKNVSKVLLEVKNGTILDAIYKRIACTLKIIQKTKQGKRTYTIDIKGKVTIKDD